VRRGRTTTCIRSHTPALSSSRLVTYVHIIFFHYLINVGCVQEPERVHAISWGEFSSRHATVLPQPATRASDDENHIPIRHPTRVAHLQPLCMQHRHLDAYGGPHQRSQRQPPPTQPPVGARPPAARQSARQSLLAHCCRPFPPSRRPPPCRTLSAWRVVGPDDGRSSVTMPVGGPMATPQQGARRSARRSVGRSHGPHQQRPRSHFADGAGHQHVVADCLLADGGGGGEPIVRPYHPWPVSWRHVGGLCRKYDWLPLSASPVVVASTWSWAVGAAPTGAAAVAASPVATYTAS